VEVAFLNGDLDETIYMDCPQGINNNLNKVVLLKKSMYGLVQAARQFFKKFTSILKTIGFMQSYADPCLFIKKVKDSVVMLAIHVDDCYIVGQLEDIELVIEEIKKNNLKVKVEYNTKDYLSCEILINKDKKVAWIGQPHLLKRLESTFGNLVMGLQHYKTPGTPSVGIVRPKDGDDIISEEDQKVYRSAVGTLLQFVKYSRPDIANQVRELAKCMDKANLHAYKELKRLIKFVLDTKNYGLKMKPRGSFDNEWFLNVYTDSDWAGDRDNRRSVSGYVIFVNDVPVLWKSKLQKSVSLSSSEAEYYALSEAAKEIKFLVQILTSIGIKVDLPVIVNVDNVGAIFMSENVSATQRTKHVDARYHYVREFVEDGFIKIIFVRTENNKSDMMTKNVNQLTYEKHVGDYILDKNLLKEDND
jgi:Reverse transcriptase (RNA-dependent DNA polymerase)